MHNILINLCKRDQGRGYIQGMNFIAATLLYHSDEYIAFGLFEILLIDYDLQDVYMNGLSGLYKHSKIIDALINEKIPALHNHLVKHEIKAEMFSSDWIIGLFSNTMPISKICKFYTLFFKEGWIVVYKTILLLL